MFDFSLGPRPLLALVAGGLTAVLLVQNAEDPAVNRGRELFDRAFAPAEGLGTPELNADSCRACHSDPVLGGAGALELNVSRCGYDNGGVGPFQDPPGGQAASKLRPPQAHGREEVPAMADVFEQRQTPSILGLGLVDTIPEAVIVANEDPADADGDGIRGVARRIAVNGAIEIGRFGWKAQIPRLADFVRDAAAGELGLTTSDNGRGFGLFADADQVPDPEFNDAQVANMFAFMAALPAPKRGGSIDAQVPIGEQLFTQIGCAKCHVPSLAGPAGPVPLFSNLLLHKVMPANFRGMVEPGAGAGFFRTPPLWGIKDTAPYMHDGRAETLLAAILAHDGEAAGVRAAFQGRADADRKALIKFLEDL